MENSTGFSFISLYLESVNVRALVQEGRIIQGTKAIRLRDITGLTENERFVLDHVGLWGTPQQPNHMTEVPRHQRALDWNKWVYRPMTMEDFK